MFCTQDEVDNAFADLDTLLADREAPSVGSARCINCGSEDLQRTANVGMGVDYHTVCGGCGAVQNACFGWTNSMYYAARKSSSNYKRIHHWHERVSQLLLHESRIPDDHFQAIAARLLDGSHTFINKDVIRSVLRSLGLQVYIEKWLQIIQRVTGVEPPKPGGQLMIKLDEMFLELQRPFAAVRDVRKNFLNYNYVFCRLFQMLGCSQFSMFFPLIKSKPKLRALDAMWERMTGKNTGSASLDWESTQLQQVLPFAVKLERPDLLLCEITRRAAAAALAAMHTVPVRKEFRKSDLRLLHALDRQRLLKQRRLDLPALELRRPARSKKKFRRA